MKCEKCNHLVRTSYEYGEYACELFGDEPPGFLDTGDGCKLMWNEAKKLSNLVDSVHYGTYQWYGRTPTNEEVERCNKNVKAYNDYWEHIKEKYRRKTMDKQKQIEEIKRIIDDRCEAKLGQVHTNNGNVTKTVDTSLIAKDIYNAGYRKIPEGAVVLTKEEYEQIYGTVKAYGELLKDIQEATSVCEKEMEEAQKEFVKQFEEHEKEIRKETAEKFAERLKDYINDKCCEELGDMACDTDYYTIDIPKTFDKIDEIAKEITEGKDDESVVSKT